MSTESRASLELKAMGVLKAPIRPVELSARMRVMFVLGAWLAALFPLIYAALIPLAAWALFRFGSLVHSAVLSASVQLAGSLILLSLLKPLMARTASAPPPHYLDPEKEPLLFALVRSLASKIGVEAPERIAVDCNVNCYCMFRGGISGVFRSGFALVIGLPLVSGLRLDQVVGALVHELGHAFEIATIRSSHLIWAVHSWLSSAACQEDRIDSLLQKRLAAAGHATKPFWRLMQLSAQPGRRILWLLWIAEGAVTSPFRRRIEIAADRYQIRASGSDRFVSAVLELNLLAVAAQRAMVEISRMKRSGRLIENYPALIAYIRDRYPADFVQRILAGLRAERTGILSAHPCDNDRIALALAEDQRGIVTADSPASVLFADYEALCREVTIGFYEQELGLSVGGCEIVPIEAIVKD